MQTQCLPACRPAFLWAYRAETHSRLKITAQSLSFSLKILPANPRLRANAHREPRVIFPRAGLCPTWSRQHTRGPRNDVWCLCVVNTKDAQCLREKAVPSYRPSFQASHLTSQVRSDRPAPPRPALPQPKGPQMCPRREQLRPVRS